MEGLHVVCLSPVLTEQPYNYKVLFPKYWHLHVQT